MLPLNCRKMKDYIIYSVNNIVIENNVKSLYDKIIEVDPNFFIIECFIGDNIEGFDVNYIQEYKIKSIYIKYPTNNYNKQLINVDIITKLCVKCCGNIPIICIFLLMYNLFIKDFYEHYCKWKNKKIYKYKISLS